MDTQEPYQSGLLDSGSGPGPLTRSFSRQIKNCVVVYIKIYSNVAISTVINGVK